MLYSEFYLDSKAQFGFSKGWLCNFLQRWNISLWQFINQVTKRPEDYVNIANTFLYYICQISQLKPVAGAALKSALKPAPKPAVNNNLPPATRKPTPASPPLLSAAKIPTSLTLDYIKVKALASKALKAYKPPPSYLTNYPYCFTNTLQP